MLVKKTYKVEISGNSKTEVKQTADLFRSMSGVDLVETGYQFSQESEQGTTNSMEMVQAIRRKKPGLGLKEYELSVDKASELIGRQIRYCK